MLAPAKVNLSLHVTGRRSDGYHSLESLVAFADLGDELTFVPGGALDLAVTGPLADGAGPAADNLVVKAAQALAARVPSLRLGRFTLVKRIPVAAGLGGGSADAAAALRLLAAQNGLSLDDPRVRAAALATGADVPVCLEPRPALMRGIGEEIERLDLPPLHAVLVNPGVAVPTATVFAELGLSAGTGLPGAPHPSLAGARDAQALVQLLHSARNDLEPAAQRIAPQITAVMAALREAGADLVRMSGSGASVFGVFAEAASARGAAAALAERQPAWWVQPARLGTGLDPGRRQDALIGRSRSSPKGRA